MSGHTPGPWSVVQTSRGSMGKDWKEIRAGHTRVVAVGTFTRTSNGEQETYAGVVMRDMDAKLMAAAPTMREELTSLAADLGVWAGMPDIPDSVRRALRARSLGLARVLAEIPETAR